MRAMPSHSVATNESTASSCTRRPVLLWTRAGTMRSTRPRRTSRSSRTTLREGRSRPGPTRSAAGCRARRTRPRCRRRTPRQHLVVVPPRERDRASQLVLVVRLRDPDRRAEPRRLHEHRVAERVRRSGVALRSVTLRVTGMPRSREHRLEEVLVHAEREAATPAPTYGTPRELEQALHRPVLAERPVQDREHDVDARRAPPGPTRSCGPAASRPVPAPAPASRCRRRAPSARRGRSRR